VGLVGVSFCLQTLKQVRVVLKAEADQFLPGVLQKSHTHWLPSAQDSFRGQPCGSAQLRLQVPSPQRYSDERNIPFDFVSPISLAWNAPTRWHMQSRFFVISELHLKGFMIQSKVHCSPPRPFQKLCRHHLYPALPCSQRHCHSFDTQWLLLALLLTFTDWSSLSRTKWVKSKFDEVGREKGKLMLSWLMLMCKKWAEGKEDPSAQPTVEHFVSITGSSWGGVWRRELHLQQLCFTMELKSFLWWNETGSIYRILMIHTTIYIIHIYWWYCICRYIFYITHFKSFTQAWTIQPAL